MPKVKVPEAVFQQQVVRYAQLNGWHVNHTRRSVVRNGQWATATSVSGYPDLTMWRPETACPGLLFAELKTDTGRLSPEQRTVLAGLEAAGAEVHVWRPSDWDQIEARLRRPRR